MADGQDRGGGPPRLARVKPAAPAVSRRVGDAEVTAVAAIAAGLPHEGALSVGAPLHLWYLAAAAQATGCLEMAAERGTLAIHFKRGVVEHATSSAPEDDLARFLLARGALAPEAVEDAERVREGFGGDLVTALAHLKLLNPAESFRVLQEHGAIVLGRALALERGAFRWDPAAKAPPSAFPLGSRWGVPCDAARRLDGLAVRKLLGDRAQRVAARSGGRVELSELRLTAHEARAAGLFDGRSSPAQLAAAHPQDADTVLRVAFVLGEMELLAFGEVATGPVASTPSPSPSRPTSKPTSKPAALPASGERERKAPSPSTQPSTSTPPAATRSPIKAPPAQDRSSGAPAGEPSHPRASSSTASAPAEPSRSPAPATAPAPLEPSQSLAPATAPAPLEPSQSLARAPGRDETRPGVRRDETRPGVRRDETRPGVRRDERGQASRPAVPQDLAALRATDERLAKVDHFQVLGVKRDATAAQVKAAYFQLAKTYHPDAAPASEPAQTKKLRADIFARLGAAWRVLGDDTARAAYSQELDSGGGPQVDVSVIFEAEQTFAKAVVLVRTRQYDRALAMLAQAMKLNADEPEFTIWKVWVEFLVAGDRKAQGRESAAAIEAALKKNPRCMPGYLFLAQMAKLQGDAALAERHLKRGLSLDPDHAELARELKFLRK